MAHYDQRWLKLFAGSLLPLLLLLAPTDVEAKRGNANLSACQHLRRFEARRAKALPAAAVRLPRCQKNGAFEPVQCANETAGLDCWCLDEYGVELPGSRQPNRSMVICTEPKHCTESACRMFCPSGFARDAQTGCTVCRCRDACDGVECPNGQSCQLQEVKCKTEPCPPVPSCKKSRSLANYCPAGLPLAIEDSVRPFLCGLDAGKPQCPPLYQCLVESANDYGVCCPSALSFQKPGICPAADKTDYSERTGYMCGSPCSHDLECRNLEKCCFTKGCQLNCQQPGNVTGCQQARALADILSINEREGRGYVPDCNGPAGQYAPKQCSRNGLVCWCVDPRTGHKIKETMGAANNVNCDGWENMISRSYARSVQMEQCDTNICAAVCEYGFKNDHNGCPSCECSEPCEGFKCALGSHCEVATDPLCESGSSLCASWPVCKPDLVYSNPCDVGTPLSDPASGEVMYCFEERQSRAFQPTAFFEPESEPESKQARAMSNRIVCPAQYKCTKLHRETERVCCPLPAQPSEAEQQATTRQQTMCEYLRDFSERMEGTEAGMQLAVPAPRCNSEGDYQARQCALRQVRVTRAEQRKILEQNTIRRMRMLLSSAKPVAQTVRTRRDTERLKLYRVEDSALKVQLAAPVMGRSAKVIDIGAERQQSLGQLFETDFKKVLPAAKQPTADSDLVDMQVEECWCVDAFGTEIPRSRGYNVSDDSCQQLRNEVDCLDLTCRMGCEYGFALDQDTRCPACQCRDPCEGVSCGDGKECRIVDVSCDEEYCPPVPACLPRKPGQCPYLVPPGPDNVDANACAYECRTDAHCEGARRCCSNGCGTQCVEPQMKTACQHLQAIQLHQSSELGIPARQMHVAQCDAQTGKWQQVQCAPDGHCWCVDAQGQALSGTRSKQQTPECMVNASFGCAPLQCSLSCDSGYKMDANGCLSCECRNYCDELSCASDEECQLISVECVDQPCPRMPICVPRRASVCAEGSPLQQGELDVSCGPHNEHEACPTTHSCQLNPVSNRGVCCSKTRDVCFESMDALCLASSSSQRNATRYRFSPNANKCLAVSIDATSTACQTKNLFHNELACNSVCPVLTQCERLKLKNSRLAAQRASQSSVWFQPRCDPITGHWSPVQCLGKQPALPGQAPVTTEVVSRAFDSNGEALPNPYGVCWCADKKGAPLKGTLTRDIEPVCNSRQARSRKSSLAADPLMEQLILQMTLLNDVDGDFGFDEVQARVVPATATAAEAAVTERVLELANSLLDSQLSVESQLKRLQLQTTRCQALATTATFPVSCDEQGGFRPLQCNGHSCWCVDAAGNQLDASHMFGPGDKRCEQVPIESVAIELHMTNSSARSIRNVYDTIRLELHQLLGEAIENLRVQENFDGTLIVRFELHNESKLDLAYALESAITAGELQLAGGHFRADITRSHFVHRSAVPPQAQAVTAQDESIQLVFFVMASCSAFLVSLFIVYVMLKRGQRKSIHHPLSGYPKCKSSDAAGGKDLDYAAPVFVLAAEPQSIKQQQAAA